MTVIVNSKRTQCLSRDCFTRLGVDPSTKKVVVVKSMQHFHAAYAPIASEVVYVAAPGALVPDWSLLPYTKIDKTQWPRQPTRMRREMRATAIAVVIAASAAFAPSETSPEGVRGTLQKR